MKNLQYINYHITWKMRFIQQLERLLKYRIWLETPTMEGCPEDAYNTISPHTKDDIKKKYRLWKEIPKEWWVLKDYERMFEFNRWFGYMRGWCDNFEEDGDCDWRKELEDKLGWCNFYETEEKDRKLSEFKTNDFPPFMRKADYKNVRQLFYDIYKILYEKDEEEERKWKEKKEAEYQKKLKKIEEKNRYKFVRKIENYYLNAKYNPRTPLGVRFANKLYDDNFN